MSVDIKGCNGEETFFSNAGWRFLLHFAVEFGWIPEGTVAPPGRDNWDGNYYAAEGQTIAGADASKLAEAIAKGIDSEERAKISAIRLRLRVSCVPSAGCIGAFRRLS
jgi:hypothetical protein